MNEQMFTVVLPFDLLRDNYLSIVSKRAEYEEYLVSMEIGYTLITSAPPGPPMSIIMAEADAAAFKLKFGL